MKETLHLRTKIIVLVLVYFHLVCVIGLIKVFFWCYNDINKGGKCNGERDVSKQVMFCEPMNKGLVRITLESRPSGFEFDSSKFPNIPTS